jgi:hypothetical protein
MLMRVRESGDEVHIELSGIAGRQQRVLQALSSCCLDPSSDTGTDQADQLVTVKAGNDAMRICIKPSGGPRIEAATVYQCLRKALLIPTIGET